MKKYVFIMQGDEVAATMNGSGKGFDKMIKIFEGAGYTAKEVTLKEYQKEEQKQEDKMWDRDKQLFG